MPSSRRRRTRCTIGHCTRTGIADANTGGYRLFLAPGLRFSASGGWAAYVSVGVPLIQRLNGVQADARMRVIADIAIGLP